MKIGLIALSGVRVRTEELAELGVTLPQFVNRGRVIATLPSLGLLTVAALTPPDIEVVYREMNEVSADDPLEPFDLVGISSFTAMIDDAYALAERYRAAGIPVVLGGLHVSLMPDEAAQHADSIVLYGAEGAWPRLVEDFRRGRLQPRYIGLRNGVFEPPHYASPRFDLLQGRPYNRITVQTSRGCPHDCEFCAASLRITSRFQQKPVDLVIAEIERAKAMGAHLRNNLEALQQKHEAIGDIRGQGLLMGIDLVKDRESREPHLELGDITTRRCLELGLSMNIKRRPERGAVWRIAPPLTVSREELDRGCEILDQALRQGLDELSKNPSA